MLHWRKAFPSSQHSLEPQHTFVWPAGCAGWLPGRLSPEPAPAQGHHGAGTEWGWQEKPHCWQGRGCWLTKPGSLRAVCVSVAHTDGEQSPGAPSSSGHPAEGSTRIQLCPRTPQSPRLCLRAFPSCSWKAKPPEFATLWSCSQPSSPCTAGFWMPSHAQLCWMFPFPSILTPNRS